jgi:hypothetical protein
MAMLRVVENLICQAVLADLAQLRRTMAGAGPGTGIAFKLMRQMERWSARRDGQSCTSGCIRLAFDLDEQR